METKSLRQMNDMGDNSFKQSGEVKGCHRVRCGCKGGRREAVQGMADVENRLGMGMSALLRRDLPKLYKPIQRPRSKF